MWKNRISRALVDIGKGFMAYRIWLSLAWLDIGIRYRRSTLGPFWITINLGVMVLALGLLYAKIFQNEVSEYLPFIAISLTLWGTLSSIVTESAYAFTASEGLIKQLSLPLSIHMYRVIARNYLILMHNAIVLLAVGLIFSTYLQWRLIFLPLSFLILAGIGFFCGLIIAVFSTRFRDVPQIITSLMQLAMFMTPIIWQRNSLRAPSQWVVDCNAFYHCIELVRAPILGQAITPLTWGVTLGLLVVSALAAMVFYGRYRGRIAYWL